MICILDIKVAHVCACCGTVAKEWPHWLSRPFWQAHLAADVLSVLAPQVLWPAEGKCANTALICLRFDPYKASL